MPEVEARRRLGAAAVARLATVGPAGQPHIVPITFAMDGDRLYSAVDFKPKTTAHLQRLRNIRADPHVSVLADHYTGDWARLWWVRADGEASVLDGPDGLARPLRLLAERYEQYRERLPAGPVICVLVQRWTGWAASGG
jgi:PPOX class probable F420-dependent enzyme